MRNRFFERSDGTIAIDLGNARHTIIDKESLTLVEKSSNWRIDPAMPRYAKGHVGKHQRPLMHRLILGASRGQWVDHINGDGLDNRRSNLRFCTASQNHMNAVGWSRISRFKGVGKTKSGKQWRAAIGCRHLGTFADERSAALAYDVAARAMYGEFARCNFQRLVDDVPD